MSIEYFISQSYILFSSFFLVFSTLLAFACATSLDLVDASRWYSNNDIEPLPVLTGTRFRLVGPVLAIEAVTAEDAGTYKCSASNAGGEASAELRLSITNTIQVDITPNVLSVHMGGTAEFRCVVTSNGVTITGQHVTWLKDGRQIPSSSAKGQTLIVSSVGREDKGMYQCVVRRQEGDSFQASAELQLGGE